MESNVISATTAVERSILDTVQKNAGSLEAEIARLRSCLNEMSFDYQRLPASDVSLIDQPQLAQLSEQLVQIWEQQRASDEARKSVEISKSNVVAQHRLLQNLQFPQMQERQEEISSAYENTYEWLFQPNPEGRSDWHNFVSWARRAGNTQSIYWIHGKPGESLPSRYLTEADAVFDWRCRLRQVYAVSVHIQQTRCQRPPASLGRVQDCFESSTLLLESGDDAAEVMGGHAAVFAFPAA